MVVCKFGGSSVADASQIRKVAAILEADPRRLAAVVSAPGKRFSEDIKITDMLYQCQAKAASGQSITDDFDLIKKRYLDIAKELGVDHTQLSGSLDEISERIASGAGADYAASRGEYLSAKLISSFMGWEFIDTEELIKLNSDGTVHESTYGLLAGQLVEGERYIIPGFYGSLVDGGVKTFSRGGSDITGAIIARALQAQEYENWTDVSGIMMADPRIIKDPQVVEKLTYQEIRELASIGANVFHEEAIAPVRSVQIPIHVKNTNDPSAPGTLMVPSRDDSGQPIVGISGKRGYCRLFIKKLLLNKETDYKLKISTILKVHGVVPEFSSTGFDSLSYYFKQDTLCSHGEFITRIEKDLEPDEISISSKIAMIGIVGEGLYDSKGILGKVSTALSEADIPIRYLNYGGSMITCIIGVDDSAYEKALKVMYQAVV